MFKKKRNYYWPGDKEILQYIAWGDPDHTWPKDWNPDANYTINLCAAIAREVLELRNNINSLHTAENFDQDKA